ncbi:hypothetical protein M2271_000377 [Streptomyces sp. LBL]|nr:hypothetical protein [Streptomyces sp. LBL]
MQPTTDEVGEGGEIEGVGDVDDDLAYQRVPVLTDDRRGARVRHGQDDEVTGQGTAADRPGCRGAAEFTGQGGGLGPVRE